MEQMNCASPLCVRSRRTYSTQCMLEYFVALLALCITAAGFALNVFAAPGAWFFAVLYTVLYAVGQAGLSQNMVNMAFN